MKESMGMSKPGWWGRFQAKNPIWLLVVAAILTAIYTTNDGHILHNIIVSSDPFTAVMAYLTLGGWVGLGINWLLCQTPAGKLIDPSFEQIKGIDKKAQMSAILAGVIGAASTLFMLWGSQIYDPSVVLPLSNAAILFVVSWEVVTGKERFSDVIWPALLVVIGAFLASVDVESGFYISMAGLIILLFFKNIISAAGEILEQKGVLASNATSFNFWRFLWLTVAGTIIALVVSAMRGTLGLYFATLALTPKAIPWILLTMVLVFFGMGLKSAAKKYTTVSRVSMVMTIPIILGAPLTWLVNNTWPGTFIEAPMTPIHWFVRIAGAVLIFWGIAKLNR
jgi:drug/metabolite transporter (DMT)-like permease